MIPPRPGKPPTLPQFVGEGATRVDVAKLSDRGIAIKALDTVLQMKNAVLENSNAFLKFCQDMIDDKATLLKQIDSYERRLSDLEGNPREPMPSAHEWNQLLTVAGHELSKRVNDTRDPLDSDRAKEIALEVVKTAKNDADAQAFRKWKSRGSKLVYEACKWFLLLALGFAASHFGLHSGHLTNDVAVVHSAGGK